MVSAPMRPLVLFSLETNVLILSPAHRHSEAATAGCCVPWYINLQAPMTCTELKHGAWLETVQVQLFIHIMCVL